MEPFLSINELYLGLALIVGFCVCWTAMFVALKGKDNILKIIFDRGNMLRMMAVIFVVIAAGYLAVLEKLSAEAATLFSGIAGYVLGGISRHISDDHQK